MAFHVLFYVGEGSVDGNGLCAIGEGVGFSTRNRISNPTNRLLHNKLENVLQQRLRGGSSYEDSNHWSRSNGARPGSSTDLPWV
jgi:hypothetical protein